MRNKAKIMIGLAVACAGCCAFAACAASDSPYGDLANSGHSITVRYESNGGKYSSYDNVQLVDVYPAALLQKGTKLVEPGSEQRGAGAASKEEANAIINGSRVSRTGYILAGWYRSFAQTRVDDAGQPVDEYGVLCSVSGKPQGYVYSDRWNFENDVLTAEGLTQSEPNKNGNTYSLTLYAAWVPEYEYDFYAQTDNGWERYASTKFNPETNPEKSNLALPKLDAEGVTLQYGDFKQAEGKTFQKAYADQALTQEYEQSVPHGGIVNLENGTLENGVRNVYSTWENGVWYHISTAKQFTENSKSDGCYDIRADLDFTDETWSNALAKNAFTGVIQGNGHKLSNISVDQKDSEQTSGGLFGEIAATASIKDVTFENVQYNILQGSRRQASFGVFAGRIFEGAQLINVTVQGKLVIEELMSWRSDANPSGYGHYSIGLLAGNYSSYHGIEYTVEWENQSQDVTLEEKNGMLVLPEAEEEN